jgi:hypothetical protein
VRRRGVGDILTTITDPGIPLLFLLGTVLLAVLGNAAYDLALAAITPGADAGTLARLGGLSAGALLLLGAVVAALWLWYNARRGPPAPPLEPARALEAGYAGLVVFVSANPSASEEAAIRHHLGAGTLRQLWLIVSGEARSNAQRLTAWLRQQAGSEAVQLTQLPLRDAFDMAAAYDAVVDALETADQLVDQLIVDITAGTKQMSAGAVLACREYGVPMQYVLGVYRDGRVVADAEARLMKVRL